MHDEVTKTTAAFAENLRKAWDDWKDQPIQWVTVGLDLGAPGGDRTVTSTTCARCSHAFTSAKNSGLLAATSAGMLSEALENEIAAHQERCFVAGDWVRWEHPRRPVIWAEGEFLRFQREGPAEDVVIRVARGYFPAGLEKTLGMHCVTLRRIPRPQQGDRVRAKQAEYVSANPHHVAIAQDDIPQAPAPVLYDGLTAEQCYERYEMRQREDGSITTLCALNSRQRAAARELWSLYLKAKLAASATEERNRVRCDLDDLDGEPW